MIEIIFIIIILIIIVIYFIKYKSKTVIIKAYDNNEYLVNDLPDSKYAADMLANIMSNIKLLINNIIKDYQQGKNIEDDLYIEYIRRINDKLPDINISETLLNSVYTSYSINKGQEIVFCIRDKKTKKIHDLNELLYVAIHEISHIACPEIGHTSLFNDINLYILKKATCYNIYKYIDYNIYNKDYCGLTLTTTILDKNYKC